ncbi:MAG TPA: ABC transporter permease [Gemmatimonadales bacterium]|nr:ABC transporter permease [Gemmatimonadales bacterium]
MVRALERKLLRDLWQMKGQVLTVALVVACGITAFVGMRSTYASLERSRATYYAHYRFGDVFAHLRRAPDAVAPRLEALPGVARVYTRVVDYVRIPFEGDPQPPVATLVTLPPDGVAPLNDLRLERGRLPEAGRPGEALLLRSFAERHGLGPGDTLPVVIKGVRHVLRIVGLANAPEFIYPIQPGSLTFDEERAAVLWMERAAIAPALDMEGAFNDVVVRLAPDASGAAVIAALDRVLEPYGSLGAVDRSRQLSDYALSGELEQLRSFATSTPLIFLTVSAFLLNVVLGRLVQLQRGQIATLKAVGYADLEIGLHYLAFVSVVVLLGTALGVALGVWFGRALTGLYGEIFHLPVLAYRLQPGIVAVSALASLAAAAVGALASAWRVVRLPPAEAMQPPAPAVYRPLLVERLGLQRLVPQAWRMVIRELERRPLRTVLSIFAIAIATGTVVLGRFAEDSVSYLLDLQFGVAAREQLDVAFTDPLPERAARELAHLPGVLRVEGMRSVPVRMAADARHRDVVLLGYAEGAELRRVLDQRGRVVPLETDGVVLTTKLAEILRVAPGDSVAVRVLEGERRQVRLPVTGLVDEMFGLQGHLRLAALNRLLQEDPTISGAQLRIEPAREPDVRRRLGLLPRVASVTSQAAERRHIERQMAEAQMVRMVVITCFAAAITVGVVYNNARIAVSMRSRELATLRVLGFSRAEVSQILLGELGMQVLLAILPGMVLGHWLTWLVTSSIDPERYRWPVVIGPASYAFATIVVLVAGTLSALLVRRHLDRLDLIGVLKTRE